MPSPFTSKHNFIKKIKKILGVSKAKRVFESPYYVFDNLSVSSIHSEFLDLGKKKSKCCCVFVKKRAFGESDSDESDGDCDHCSGHTPSDNKVCQ